MLFTSTQSLINSLDVMKTLGTSIKSWLISLTNSVQSFQPIIKCAEMNVD